MSVLMPIFVLQENVSVCEKKYLLDNELLPKTYLDNIEELKKPLD